MKIHYISDLHFDYKEFCEKEKFLKMLNCNDLYIIAGDCYNDYRKTLKLIIELENKKIKGYWILGNHEYMYLCEPENIDPKNKGKCISKMASKKKYMLLLNKIKAKVSKNKYFKMLYTGKKVELNKKWILIGDTGWSSFKFNNGTKIDDYRNYSWNHLNNWAWTNDERKKFIKFANNVIKENDNVLIVTHHPMYLPNKNNIATSRLKDKGDNELLFWFSKGEINVPKNKNVRFIHGHTHTEPFKSNHYSNAIGRLKDEKKLEIKSINI